VDALDVASARAEEDNDRDALVDDDGGAATASQRRDAAR
jgi:hypothetical protein